MGSTSRVKPVFKDLFTSIDVCFNKQFNTPFPKTSENVDFLNAYHQQHCSPVLYLIAQLKREIQRTVTNPLSVAILSEELQSHKKATLYIQAHILLYRVSE